MYASCLSTRVAKTSVLGVYRERPQTPDESNVQAEKGGSINHRPSHPLWKHLVETW
jgi:hypothetical protein